MPKTKSTSDEVMIDLLQKIIIIELAKQKVPQNDIARIGGVSSVKINTLLKFFNSRNK